MQMAYKQSDDLVTGLLNFADEFGSDSDTRVEDLTAFMRDFRDLCEGSSREVAPTPEDPRVAIVRYGVERGLRRPVCFEAHQNGVWIPPEAQGAYNFDEALGIVLGILDRLVPTTP